MYVDIVLLHVGQRIEDSLLTDLQEICEAAPRRGLGLTYECTTDKLKKITHILAVYEKEGMEIVAGSARKGERATFTIRPWIGESSRALLFGGYQLRRKGALLNYASRKEMLKDAPLFEKETFNHWLKVRPGTFYVLDGFQ